MKKKVSFLMIFLLLVLVPSLAFASTGNSGSDFSVGTAIGMEAFVSIHMSVFVLIPLAKMMSEDNWKNVFIVMFVIRAVFLLYFDFFVTPLIFMLDFISIFIGAFIIVPILTLITEKGIKTKRKQEVKNIEKKASAFKKTTVPYNVTEKKDDSPIVTMNPTYLQNGRAILREVVKDRINKRVDNIKELSTAEVNNSKGIVNLAFGLLTFIYTLLYFFNFELDFCIACEGVTLCIYLIVMYRLDIVSVICRKAIQNPDKDIDDIIFDMKEDNTQENISNPLTLGVILAVAIISPIIAFSQPKTLYLYTGSGYAVMKHTRSLTEEIEDIVIPEQYKGKDVVSIGNEAFANTNIKSISLPKNLKNIGVKAFYNCSNLENIVIPDNVITIKESAFENCTSLKSINLPENLKNVSQALLKNDINLAEIYITEGVTKIGKEAFYGCKNLSYVYVPSTVKNIENLAFGKCNMLRNIELPKNIYIKETAFSQSPTMIQTY